MNDTILNKQVGAVALWLQSTVAMLAAFGLTSSWFTVQTVLVLQAAASGIGGAILLVLHQLGKKSA